LLRVDISLLETIGAKQIAEPKGIMFVIAVLQSGVLLIGGGMGQINRIPVFSQGVHEPVPVERGLDNDPGKRLSVGLQLLEKEIGIIQMSLLVDPLAVCVHDAQREFV
jgi:hypothetical protein